MERETPMIALWDTCQDGMVPLSALIRGCCTWAPSDSFRGHEDQQWGALLQAWFSRRALRPAVSNSRDYGFRLRVNTSYQGSACIYSGRLEEGMSSRDAPRDISFQFSLVQGCLGSYRRAQWSAVIGI